MGYAQTNLEELYFAPGGANFPANGTDAFGMGEADEGSVAIEPFSPISVENRDFTTLMDHKYSKKTYQWKKEFVAALLTCFKANDATVMAITSGLSFDETEGTCADGGIFKHENAKSMGVEFEWNLTPKDRSNLITFQRAYPVADSLAIITAATDVTLPPACKVPALDAANTLKAYIVPSFGAGITIAEDQLDDWFFKIKTRTNKTAFNKSRGKRIDVEINAVMDGADPADAVALMTPTYVPDIVVTIGVATPWTITFKSGGLFRSGKLNIDKDKRICTAMLKGSYSMEYYSVDESGNITFGTQIN